jgi:hypothetical protein
MSIECTAENAPKFREWIATRGGVARWPSVNLSNIGASWSTPVLTASGEPTPKPNWQAASAPSEIATSEDQVNVFVPKEVRRFRVATRMGSQGFSVKLTDASGRKLRAALEKAGEGSWHQFDYSTQEAIIFVADSTIPLSEWNLEEALR